MSPSGDILPLFGVIVPLRPKNLLCRPLQPKASLQGHVAALLRQHAALQSCCSALSSSSTVPMCIVPMERQKAERRAHDVRKVRIMEQGKRKENWHRRRPRRSTREGGSPKLEIRWRRRHKVWRWGRLCHRPLVVAFPAFCIFQGEVTRSVNLLALNCPLPSAVILSSRRRVDSSRIEAARRARSTETGNGKHSFLRWNN